MKNFSIIGTGRSATKYISELLTELGIKTGHEVVNYWGFDYESMPTEFPEGYVGNASFADISIAEKLKSKGFIILHQTRDKGKVIDALERAETLKYDNVPTRHYNHFLNYWCKKFEGVDLFTIKNYRDRLSKFYDIWNKKAKEIAHYSYNVENLDVEKVQMLLNMIEVRRSKATIQKALDKLPKDINSTLE